MGYTTDFTGSFKLDKKLAPEHYDYLCSFAGTRRMRRDAARCAARPDPIREAAKLPVGEDGGYFVGEDGGYFVGETGHAGQDNGPDVIEHNSPPQGQPELWCQWVPNVEGTEIQWDGGEKFYGYIEWIQYLIEHFLKPWGYTLNGEVEWIGEDPNDRGKIIVKNNIVRTQVARIVFEDDEVDEDAA